MKAITKIATVRDLRNNFAKLESWLEAGERIEIRRRGRPVATLTPSAAMPAGRKAVVRDFAGRRRAIWGDRVFTLQEVERMNEMEREGDEG